MPTRDEVYNAIRKADAAGDGESVRKLAAYLETMPAEERSAVGDFASGVGIGVKKVGRALKQALDMGASALEEKFGGQGVSRALGMPTAAEAARATNADIQAANVADAPVLATTAGKFGNIVGQAGAVAPTMFIPGANTLTGAALIGAGTGALTTEGDLATRAKSGLAGAAGGVAGQLLGRGIGMGAEKLASMRADKLAAAEAANAGRVSAVNTAREAGYVLPPTEIKPTALNSALEGLSGKIKTSQAASARNQAVTNDLAKRALGMDSGDTLSKEWLAAIRAEAGKAYGDVAAAGTFAADDAFKASIDAIKKPLAKFEEQFPQLANKEVKTVLDSMDQPTFDAGAVVEAMKRLRFDGNANRMALDPAKKELGNVQIKAAKALEDLAERNLETMGASGLLQEFRAARQLIAKTHTVEKALNDATGDVSAPALAKMLEKGRPLSGDLKTVAEVAQAFPKATQALKQNYNAVSPLDYLSGGIAGTATGNPLGLATIMARPAARATILSPAYQRMAQAAMERNGSRVAGGLLGMGQAQRLPEATTLLGILGAVNSQQ